VKWIVACVLVCVVPSLRAQDSSSELSPLVGDPLIVVRDQSNASLKHQTPSQIRSGDPFEIPSYVLLDGDSLHREFVAESLQSGAWITDPKSSLLGRPPWRGFLEPVVVTRIHLNIKVYSSVPRRIAELLAKEPWGTSEQIEQRLPHDGFPLVLPELVLNPGEVHTLRLQDGTINVSLKANVSAKHEVVSLTSTFYENDATPEDVFKSAT